MKLSVVIPYYDETIFIRQTVASCLALEDALHEVIIVNDGLRGFDTALFDGLQGREKIQLIHNERNLGHPGSRNVGMEAASGEFAMFLDADDLLLRDSMLSALDFAAKTRADVTHLPSLSYRPRYGAWERFERDRQLLAKRRSGLTIDDAPELRYSVATWSWLFRRDFIRENELRVDQAQLRYVDHLYAVEVLQAAQRISMFDAYPHVWRRRGASMSTERENPEQFRQLIRSIGKTCGFLEQHYPQESSAFQRDLGFFLMRLLGQWNLLHDCIPVRHEDRESAAVLEQLAQALEPYQLDPSILDDPILARIGQKRITPEGRKPISRREIPALFGFIVARDWERLGKAIGAASHSSASAQPTLPADQTATSISPALQLWQAYSAGLNAQDSLEHRLFTEYLLDEMDEAFHNRPHGKAAEPVDWPLTMHTDLATLARRFDTAALFPPAAGWEECSQLRDNAASLTDAYLQAKTGTVEAEHSPRRSDVLDAWRKWETAVLGNAFSDIENAILARGSEASRGDANWQAKRTIKSRFRARVIEPIIRNSA
ncbi:glycosyltransferase family 2 protein [Altererythrobacter sp. GH1-8]|uniref:glycosyltransferase family 2 protein n=1 Tax=Altererythrobacter sp. GH1-8 TaxID=3349333 RepID=UPI00374D8D09